MNEYNAIVIGSGQAGNPLASSLASDGQKVLLVEKNLVGGTCVNTGCTPSKTLHEIVRKIHYAKNLEDKGFGVESNLDFDKLMDHVRELRDTSREGLKESLEEKENLEIIYGTASFLSNKEVTVSPNRGENISAKADKIFINTGARPMIPPIEGVETIDYLTNENIFKLKQLPESLLILGGGFNGIEFAQSFARLGTKVTVLNRSEKIIQSEDDDIIEALSEILKEEAMEIVCGFEGKRIEKTSDGLKISNGEKEFSASHILIATGRKPNTEALNLENTDIDTGEKGIVKVDEQLQTSVSGVYALGEVAGTPQFTHFSYDDFRVVRDNLMLSKENSTDKRPQVFTLFTDPQLGRYGYNEKQAKAEGITYSTYKMPAAKFARAYEKGETNGLVKVLVRPDSKEIIGVSALISEGGELMSLLQVAAAAGMTAPQLQAFRFAHPLLSEGLNNLFS